MTNVKQFKRSVQMKTNHTTQELCSSPLFVLNRYARFNVKQQNINFEVEYKLASSSCTIA